MSMCSRSDSVLLQGDVTVCKHLVIGPLWGRIQWLLQRVISCWAGLRAAACGGGGDALLGDAKAARRRLPEVERSAGTGPQRLVHSPPASLYPPVYQAVCHGQLLAVREHQHEVSDAVRAWQQRL
jgi:hypothetical protein